MPHTHTIIDPVAFAKSAAVIASAEAGKEPKKAAKAPRKLSLTSKAKMPKGVKKAAKATPAKVAPEDKAIAALSGKALKVFCGEYGLTPKQARVVLRRAWRNDAGLLHKLRNRWIFSKDQEKLARSVFKGIQKSRDLSPIEADDEE
jgi:hypothetical protein